MNLPLSLSFLFFFFPIHKLTHRGCVDNHPDGVCAHMCLTLHKFTTLWHAVSVVQLQWVLYLSAALSVIMKYSAALLCNADFTCNDHTVAVCACVLAA